MKQVNLLIATAIGLVSIFGCSKSEPINLKNTSLIPEPYSFQGYSGSPFILNENTDISYSDVSLQKIAQQFSSDIHQQTGISLSVAGNSSNKESKTIFLELSDNIPALNDLPKVNGISPKDGNPVDEQYLLTISSKRIHINATAPEGIYRGLTSLRQLMNSVEDNNKEIQLVPLEIKDSPRFAWRGLSYDVSRYFSEVSEVKKVIDMLSLYKMNVMHWHLTDNQGWRIEIKKYPLLTEVGSQVPNRNRKGGYYSQEQYKEIVQYAADRFITVVPEIDFPGHTAAVFASYPELKNAVTPRYLKLNIGGLSLGALDPEDEKTMEFVKGVFTELAAITPGSYIHIGGDEAFGMPEEKFIKFINNVIPIVKGAGKKVVGWQEIARADIGAEEIFQHWIKIDIEKMLSSGNQSQISMLPPEIQKLLIETFTGAEKDVELGIGKHAKTIISPTSFSYLDSPYGETSSDTSQEEDRSRLGLRSYPLVTLEEFYSWDPTTIDSRISIDNIAGIEAAIWCETVESFSDLQFLVLPRLTGLAEKGWSQESAGNWADYGARLGSQSPLWNKAEWNFFKASSIDWK